MQRYVFSFLILLLFPKIAFAATISLQATPSTVGVGDIVKVTILLDSRISINAFSGVVQYPTTMLEPIAVSDGGSIISMWINRPTLLVAPIAFAGITPNGFSGENGTLFSLLFRAKMSGIAKVSLDDSEVLRNDGTGGREPTTVKSLALSVASSSGGYTEPIDHSLPEPFTAYLSNDPSFNGYYNLLFSTVDKVSGIDHYLVSESRLPSFLFFLFPHSWQRVTSPYRIADQNLTSFVYLKAVNRAGNEQLSIFPPQHFLTTYEEVTLFAILIGVVFLFRKRWWRRHKKHHATSF